MALLRIVAPDHVVEQLHREALRDNRSDSAMGLICLRESLDRRREQRSQIEQVAQLIAVMKTPTQSDAQ